MQHIGFITLCALLFCTAMQAKATQFMEHSKIVEKACFANLKRTPVTQWLDLDTTTGLSPMTVAALCYRNGIKVVVRETKYQHAELANNFAETVVKISQARDEGKISARTALALYRGLSSEFRTFIAIEDVGDQLQESKHVEHGINGVISSIEEVKAGR